MAVDPVPYVVHGAKHSADVFRQAHYDAMGGAHGISSVGALHVKQTGTPSNQVQVAPGGATILNTYQGGAGQAYSFRNASTTLVDVPASDSTGAKSWWIIACIEDPQFGGQAPSDPLAGPYAFIRCVAKDSNIDYPHELLAEIVVPKSTATITNGMITSKREVARPRSKPELRTYALLSEDTETLATTGVDSSTGETWPRQADTVQEHIDIPEWATRVRIVQTWAGVLSPGTRIAGRVWLQIGGDGNPNHVKTQTVKYATGPTDSRDTIVVADMKWIPPELRGTAQKFIPRGNREPGSGGVLTLDGASAIVTQIEFMERADQ